MNRFSSFPLHSTLRKSLSLTLTAALLTSGCGLLDRSDDTAEFGGFVVDIATGKKLTEYEMLIETPDGDTTANIDDETGKFNFTIPRTSDYQVTVTSKKFRPFTSTNRAPYLAEAAMANTDEEIVPSLAYYFSVPMIHEKLETPEVVLRFADATDGKKIDGGAFRLSATGVAGGFAAGVYGDGQTIAGMQWWMPDASAISGEIKDGEVKIDANQLLPGFTYTLNTIGVEGYQDANAEAITVSSTRANLARGFHIKLRRNTVPETPVLVAQSNLDAVGNPIPTGRSIQFFFEKDVDFNLEGLNGLTAAQILTVISPDSDRDGATTATKIRGESVARTSRTGLLSITTDQKSITITFNEDGQLIDGAIDADDDLAYQLSPAFLGGIKVKDHLATSPGSWISLGQVNVKPVLVVRSNRP